MKLRLTLASVFLAMLSLARAEDGGPAEIDGTYHVLPVEAPTEYLLSQGLGELLVAPIKFYQLKYTGKVEAIALTAGANSIRVVAIDSAGKAVLDQTVPAVRSKAGNVTTWIVDRDWESHDEWGSARGRTVTEFRAGKDGSLVVRSAVTLKSGRTLVFPEPSSTTVNPYRFLRTKP